MYLWFYDNVPEKSQARWSNIIVKQYHPITKAMLGVIEPPGDYGIANSIESTLVSVFQIMAKPHTNGNIISDCCFILIDMSSMTSKKS